MEGKHSGIETTTRDLQGWSNPHFRDAKDWHLEILIPGAAGVIPDGIPYYTISAWARKRCFRVSEIFPLDGGVGGSPAKQSNTLPREENLTT